MAEGTPKINKIQLHMSQLQEFNAGDTLDDIDVNRLGMFELKMTAEANQQFFAALTKFIEQYTPVSFTEVTGGGEIEEQPKENAHGTTNASKNKNDTGKSEPESGEDTTGPEDTPSQ